MNNKKENYFKRLNERLTKDQCTLPTAEEVTRFSRNRYSFEPRIQVFVSYCQVALCETLIVRGVLKRGKIQFHAICRNITLPRDVFYLLQEESYFSVARCIVILLFCRAQCQP